MQGRGAPAAPRTEVGFSRPGFLTFRVDSPVFDSTFDLIGTFVRTSGWSIGRVGGEGLEGRCEQLVHEIDRRRPDVVHLWPRDRAVPGDHHFEPLPSQHVVGSSSSSARFPPVLDSPSPRSIRSLPSGNACWTSCLWTRSCGGLASREPLSLERRWPGGVPPIDLPSAMVGEAGRI